MGWDHQLSSSKAREALAQADGDCGALQVPQTATSSEDLAVPAKDACQPLLSVSHQRSVLPFCPARASLFPGLQLRPRTNQQPPRFL